MSGTVPAPAPAPVTGSPLLPRRSRSLSPSTQRAIAAHNAFQRARSTVVHKTKNVQKSLAGQPRRLRAGVNSLHHPATNANGTGSMPKVPVVAQSSFLQGPEEATDSVTVPYTVADTTPGEFSWSEGTNDIVPAPAPAPIRIYVLTISEKAQASCAKTGSHPANVSHRWCNGHVVGF